MRVVKWFWVMPVLFVVSACGSGSSSSTNLTPDSGLDPDLVNRPPVISGRPAAATENKPYSFKPVYSDPDGDGLIFSVANAPGWLSLDTATGELSGIAAFSDDGVISDIEVSASDASSTTTLVFDLRVHFDPLEQAIRTGDASLVADVKTFLDAAQETISADAEIFRSLKKRLFHPGTDGTTLAGDSSLTAIDWNPTHDSAWLLTTPGFNIPVLTSNSPDTVSRKSMGVGGFYHGNESDAKYLVLGGNPMRNYARNPDLLNAQMHAFLKNAINWLSGRYDYVGRPLNIVLAQLDQSYYFPDQNSTRAWLDEYYAGEVTYNAAASCDGTKLLTCVTDETDLLLISQITRLGEDAEATSDVVKVLLERGVSVLYVHHDGNLKPLGRRILSLLQVDYGQDNYWAKRKIDSYDGTTTYNDPSPEAESAGNLLSRFSDGNFSVDLSLCRNTGCQEESRYSEEFKEAAEIVQKIFQDFDRQKINIFDLPRYRYQKLLILLADKYRQLVTYPMDKTATPTRAFLQSLYSDYAVYNQRDINPAQTDMGNFSRSDFSHVTPVNRVISIESKKPSRSAGVYLIPGVTATITRKDSAAVNTSFFVNTLRSGATHQFDPNQYNRPKFLKSTPVDIGPGESVSVTSAYGGPIQIGFDANDLGVEFSFQNIGLHAYWNGPEDDDSFLLALAQGDYDWAEFVTPHFEVHSTRSKMVQTMDNPNWGTASELAAVTRRYMHNFPHVLAGFTGPGITPAPEIEEFASQNGYAMDRIDMVKHMNADQPLCGYGCAGNPYDAYWHFDPVGHGDLHELGHGLERGRFRFVGWDGHASTNYYAYYSQSQFNAEGTGLASCQQFSFKGLFDTLQESKRETDAFAYMQAADLNGWRDGAKIYIQMMMLAENEDILQNGWHLLALLHILEREFNRARADDAAWLAKRDSLGFGHFTRTEAGNLNNNDWLTIAISRVLGRDMRTYLTMWGFSIGADALTQVESYSYLEVPAVFYADNEPTYLCHTGLDNKTAITIDGVSPWPLN